MSIKWGERYVEVFDSDTEKCPLSVLTENMVAICWEKSCLLYAGVHIKWVSLEWGSTVALDDFHIVINCSQFLYFGFLLFVLWQISIFLGKCVLNIL